VLKEKHMFSKKPLIDKFQQKQNLRPNKV